MEGPARDPQPAMGGRRIIPEKCILTIFTALLLAPLFVLRAAGGVKIAKPEPMFGVAPAMLKAHGLPTRWR